jgi:hypothetical protein
LIKPRQRCSTALMLAQLISSESLWTDLGSLCMHIVKDWPEMWLYGRWSRTGAPEGVTMRHVGTFIPFFFPLVFQP